MTNAELENKIIEMNERLKIAYAENIYLKDECKQLQTALTVLGETCHAIYKCYPYIFSECCTHPDLLKMFKVQDSITNAIKQFFNKLNGGNNGKEK